MKPLPARDARGSAGRWSPSSTGEHAVRHGQRHDGGEHGEPGGDDERRAEAVLAEDGLADHRADAEPGEHGDGEVARRLGPPIGRREVGDERGGADEQGGLADAGDAAQGEERRQVVDGGAEQAGERRRSAQPPIIIRRRP